MTFWLNSIELNKFFLSWHQNAQKPQTKLINEKGIILKIAQCERDKIFAIRMAFRVVIITEKAIISIRTPRFLFLTLTVAYFWLIVRAFKMSVAYS